MKFVARKVDDGVNISKNSPLREFLLLGTALSIFMFTLVLVLSFISDYLVAYIPIELEQKLFSATTSSFSSAETNQTHEQTQEYLNEILNKLNTQSEGAEFPYRLLLSDMEEANAFALPGGQIVVTRGLLSRIQTENGLAMVIAHELAHQQLRHPIRSLGRTIIVTLAITSLFGMENSTINSYLTSGVNLTLLSFSRDQEREADELGQQMLKKTYGHASGASEFFESMQSGEAPIPKFMLTHPLSKERIEQLKSKKQGTLTKLDPIISKYISEQDVN